MSALTIYHESCPKQIIFTTTESDEMTKALAKIGVGYQRCQTNDLITPLSNSEQVANVYQPLIETLLTQGGYQSWDVVALHAQHPDKSTLRQKFLAEHTHGEDEIRFFVSGQGLFTIHCKEYVYSMLCVKGDFINVPANTLHWFDMGSEPHFIAIRFFNNPQGWIATYSNNNIALRFPTLD